jgi:hypothetical protein
MRPSNTSILPVSILILGSIALPDAARSATISYHQVGICKGYDTPAGLVTARSDEGFAIFKIEAVDNTKPSESFDFDPTHLYVDQSTPEQKAKTAVWDKNRRFMYPDQRFWFLPNNFSPIKTCWGRTKLIRDVALQARTDEANSNVAINLYRIATGKFLFDPR